MTQEAINQLFEHAHNGDVFAMTLAGHLLCEGKIVGQNFNNVLGGCNRQLSAIAYTLVT